MSAQANPVLSKIRTLVRLIHRLPREQKQTSLLETRTLIRSRAKETDNQKALDHQRELASKIAYLRIITPKQSGETASSTGTYVLREGKLMEGSGETRGSRRVSMGMGLTCHKRKRWLPPCGYIP